MRKEAQMKFYKVISVPTLLYGIETWVRSQEDYTSRTGAEVVYLRSLKGCTRLDCFHSEGIRQKLSVTLIIANIASYRKWWEGRLLRMGG